LVVVDLQSRALEVAHALRNPLLRVERVRPSQAGALYRTDVTAKKLEHLALVRVHHEETGQDENRRDESEAPPDHRRRRSVARSLDDFIAAENDQPDAADQNRQARDRNGFAFANHDVRPPRNRYQSDITLLSFGQ